MWEVAGDGASRRAQWRGLATGEILVRPVPPLSGR